jgi:hypothetical protein
MGKLKGLAWLFSWLIAASGAGQSLVWKDTAVTVLPQQPAGSASSLLKYRFTQNASYSLSCTNLVFSNWHNGSNGNSLSLFHQLGYRCQITNNRNFNLNNSFRHDLGIQYFFDSLARFYPDENILETKFELKIRKKLSVSVLSTLSTQLFNAFIYGAGPAGNHLKILNSAFLTPLLWNLSAGISPVFPAIGSITLGLSAAKFTLVRCSSIYEQQKILYFHGVPKGKRIRFEYGLGFHLLVDKNFLERFHWNCDLLMFKNYQTPVDLVVKNLIGVRIYKSFKASLQTRLNYEKDVSRWLQVENQLSLGFYFHL